MRKLIIVFLIALIAKDVSSQGDHFIYIQADSQQPFYVRSGTKLFRSSGEGYLVIPNLISNSYDLIVGFSGASPATEWRFECTIGENDLGYTLKNNGSSPPQLINLGKKSGLTGTKVQAKENKKQAAKPVELTGIISDDPFSKMLAAVVNDPTIRQQPVIIEKKTEPALAIAPSTTDSTTNIASTNTVKKDSMNQAAGLTAAVENKSATSTVSKENKPFVVKETPLKADSTHVAAKTDSAGLRNTVAAKKQNDQPFVVKEIKKETKTGAIPNTPAGNDTSSAIAQVPETRKEPFVLKETVNARAEITEAKDSANKALTAQANEAKPVAGNTKPKEKSFVVRELPDENANSSTTNDDAGGKKTLPFTVQPKDETLATKQSAKVDNKTSKTTDSDSAAKKTTSVTAQPKEAPVAIKKVPEADSKTTAGTSDSVGDKKTLPFIVEPRKETFVVKELPEKSAEDNSKRTTTGTAKETGKAVEVPKTPNENKDFVLKETIPANNKQSNKTGTKPAATTSNVVTSSVSIKKTLQRKSIDGIELIYVDEGENGAKDTIRILIPAEK